MKYLLDTHSFLWSVTKVSQLPEKVAREIKNPENEVYVSSVNLWEIAIKERIKKLDLGGIAVTNLISIAGEMGFQLIGLSPEEAVNYGNLEENSHFDPFDRMLIWQAIGRKLVMVSRDPEFNKFLPHGLKILWK